MVDLSARRSSGPAPAGFELNKSIGIATFVTLILSLKDIPEVFSDKYMTCQTILFVILFSSLRLKIFLDHHEHFHKTPYGSMLIDFAFSIASWTLYALSAAFLAKHIIFSFACLIVALAVSLCWCLYARKFNHTNLAKRKQQGIWAMLNVFYMAPLSFVAWDMAHDTHNYLIVTICYLLIFIIVMYDWSQSKSWEFAYVKVP